MDAAFIFHLKQPCKNRGIELVNNGDGTINLDGQRFDTMHEAENYIESKPRQDFNA